MTTHGLSRRTLVSLAGGGLSAGCASAVSPNLTGGPLLLSSEEVEREWARLVAPMDSFVPGKGLRLDDVLDRGRSKGKRSRSDEVALGAVRTLFLSGAFSDLPEPSRVHPTVQDTMWQAMPSFDTAMRDVKGRLDALSPTERADLTREFRKDPGLAERVLAVVDEAARGKDVSDARRLHMRRMGLWVCDRLNHSSEMLVGEYSAKMEKVFEKPPTIAQTERKLMARLGEDAYFAMRSRVLEAEERYRVAGVARTPTAGEDDKTSRNLFIAGGVFMGLATIAGVSGAILLATAGIGGAFVLTAGAVFLLTGLILLIVGAALS